MPLSRSRRRVHTAAVALLLLFLVSFDVLPADGGAPTILVFGDSLSAGYGLGSGQGWVDLLQHKLEQEQLAYRVVNASISGETTSGGKSRIDAALKRFAPAVVILELGANDGLRGSTISAMRTNLVYIIEHAQASGARIVLVGMRLPPNYGPFYTTQFFQTFRDLANKYHVAYVPFLFEGLPDDPQSFQADRLHPSAQAQQVLLNNVWQTLKSLLKGAQ